MKFCPVCKLNLRKDILEDKVVFICLCGYKEDGGDQMRRIGGKATSNNEMNQNLITWAPVDPITQKIMKDCPECGLDYISQCKIVNDACTIFEGCSCGYSQIINE